MHTRIAVACLLCLCTLAPLAGAATQADLDQAVKQQRVAFILVSEPGTLGLEPARDMIRQAMAKVDKATLIELDRSAAGNAELVTKYRLTGTPLPLILVAARNGALGGGLPAAQATVERLVALVPSPKKAELLQNLQGGNAVILCASRQGMSARAAALANCATACVQSSGQCVLVEIEMDDPAEAAFLTSLKVSPTATEPTILVVNTSGQISGSYTGAADPGELVAASVKKAGGCAPGACAPGAKGCGPVKSGS
jgi:hypothetical protein